MLDTGASTVVIRVDTLTVCGYCSCKFFSGGKNPENLEQRFLCFLVSFDEKMFVSGMFR